MHCSPFRSGILKNKAGLMPAYIFCEACKSMSASWVFKPEFEGSVLQYSTENEWRRIPRRWRAIASRKI